MRFLSKPELPAWFEGKTVAIVGSGPGCLENKPGFIDSHEVVVRVNNYKLFPQTGKRTDVFYSFFGSSIRKEVDELKRDGVRLCMCKCPNAHAIESEWHRKNGKMNGVDFRWIYENRRDWWFCDTYIPKVADFRASFDLLGGHIPTTGFAAILDIFAVEPKAVYLTGFDGFRSGIHNVNQPWRHKNNDDPIGHVPEQELSWLAKNAPRLPVTMDPALSRAMKTAAAA
jgi:hypothetical protein